MRILPTSSKKSLPYISNQPIKPRLLSTSQTHKHSIAVLADKTRVRNYISLYSSTAPKDFLKLPEKNEQDDDTAQIRTFSKVNTGIKNLSETSAKVLKASDCLQVLQRKCNELLYDIQKAKSDKLELTRDVATYEHEFKKNKRVFEALSSISELAQSIPATDLEIPEINDLLLSGFSQFLKATDPQFKYQPEPEVIELKHPAYSKVKSTLLNCSLKISDTPCIAHIHGTKWLEELEITITTMSNKTYKKSLKHTLLSLYSTKQELFKIVSTEILPKFYFIYNHSHNNLILMHNPDHGSKFQVFSSYIRGYGKCSLSLSVNNNKLNIQVIEQKEVLEVPEDMLRVTKLEEVHLKTVKTIVHDFIYYDKYSKGFYWQNEKLPENVFCTKESTSKFLKDDYLKEILSMKSFKVVSSFLVHITDLEFLVELHIFKQQFKLLIFFGRESVEILQESKHFKYLIDLQWVNILLSPITLKNSLEIQQLIRKQFPRLFNIKAK